MDGLAAARVLIPKIPSILKTILLYYLSRSPTSDKWDLRTEITIHVIRLLLNDPRPQTITEQQNGTLRDPGIKGRMWISKLTMPAPTEDDVRQVLFEAIHALKEGSEEYTRPDLAPVEGEWTGYRAGVPEDAPELPISEADKYRNLIKEVTTDVTVLYFHGGSLYLMDPCTNRGLAAKYAELTGGRVFSVRYRLAPQNPFPSALLDALVAYLSLLYPPPGAFHDAIPASQIVISGDSGGGNIATALLQTLLQIQRNVPSGKTPTVIFHGREVEVPLPAGVVLNSPSIDLTRAMPSTETNAKYDYLPAPFISTGVRPPPCDIWPSDPPRADLYCEGSALCHPLVSSLTSKSWEGSPPIFVVCGEEMLADEDKLFAQKAAKQSVTVIWEQHEAMPHCFALFLDTLPQSNMSFASWASFCKKVVDTPELLVTEGALISAKDQARLPVDVCALSELKDDDILGLMRDSQQKMIDFMNS